MQSQVACELRVKGMTRPGPGLGLGDKSGKSSTGKRQQHKVKDPKGADDKEAGTLEKAEIVHIQDEREIETLEVPTQNESFESAASPPRQGVNKMESINSATLECDICGKFYGNSASLRTHKWNHAKKGEVVKTLTENVIKEENHIVVLDDDVNIDEIDEKELMSIKKKLDNESILDQTFGDNAELEEKIDKLSERREDGLWICNQCGKTDKQRWILDFLNILKYSVSDPDCLIFFGAVEKFNIF